MRVFATADKGAIVMLTERDLKKLLGLNGEASMMDLTQKMVTGLKEAAQEHLEEDDSNA